MYFNYEINIGDHRDLSGWDFIQLIQKVLGFKVEFYELLNVIICDYKKQNWVDIEGVYYRLLCDAIKENSKITPKE